MEQQQEKPVGEMLEGRAIDLRDERQRTQAVDWAFDYRGDVTIHTQDGRAIEGYIFDRRKDTPQPLARILTKEGQRVTIPYAQMVRLVFSGKDAAAGKSWETWVKKYHDQKAKGEAANIEAEPLE